MKIRELKIVTAAAVLALGLGLSACGGGGSSTKTATPEEMCTAAGGSYADGRCTSAEELAVMAEAKAIADALAEAEAAADALTAASSTGDVDAAKALARTARDAVTGAMHASASATAASLAALNAVDATITTADMAVMDRIAMETATANRAAMQSAAIRTAAAAVDTSDLSTPAAIAAASAAIAALQAAIDAAVDVDDTSMYESQVTAANTAVMTAQGALDHAGQTDRLSAAVAMLRAIDLSDLTDQAKIDAAAAVIAGLQSALDAATELSDAEKSSAMADLATANRTVMAAQVRVHTENQKMALSDAVDALAMIDTGALMTQDAIDAAERAIAALEVALAAASNLTDAEKLDATVDVTLAKRRVASAQEALDTNVEGQRMALMSAGTALGMIDLGDLDTQEKIDAADAAVMALKAALDMASHLSDSEKAMYRTQLDAATETVTTAQTGMDRDGRMMAQRTAITTAVTMARAAVGMVDDDATDAEVMAADDAIAALKAAIDGADDLPEGDTDVATAQGALDTFKDVLATAKMSRMAALDAAQMAADMDMVAEAARLYAGIDLQPGALLPRGNDTVAKVSRSGIEVGIRGVTGNTARVNIEGEPIVDESNLQALSEDKETMVPGNLGWEGKRYAHEFADGGMIEAYVYTREEEREQGLPFNEVYTGTAGLTSGGVLPSTTVQLDMHRDKIASPSFDQRAGFKRFELPENHIAVMIDGSFHGVPGTYSCRPTAGSTCAVRLDVKINPTDAEGASDATAGFALGLLSAANAFSNTAGAWAFKPDDPGARVTPAARYSWYGWWLYKPAGDGDYFASALGGSNFVHERTDLRSVGGSASYSGSAAGLYALTSTAGGANESGRFTARAVLEADFHENTVTGELDQFKVGDDGEARDWSVELMEQGIYDDSRILGDGVGTFLDFGGGITGFEPLPPRKTKWTIGGSEAEAGGEWYGHFRNPDEGGVPGVMTGQFSAEYGHEGRMVGGFAARRDEE